MASLWSVRLSPKSFLPTPNALNSSCVVLVPHTGAIGHGVRPRVAGAGTPERVVMNFANTSFFSG
jgi:hypothetical protein